MYLGDLQKARLAFLRAAELSGPGIFANASRGASWQCNWGLQGAVAWEGQSLLIHPDMAVVHEHLAWYNSNLGEHQNTIAAATKAIASYASQSSGLWENYLFVLYQVRADALAHLNMYQEAVEDYSKSLESAPYRWDIYEQRALVEYRLNDYDKCLADVAKAVELKGGEISNREWIPLRS